MAEWDVYNIMADPTKAVARVTTKDGKDTHITKVAALDPAYENFLHLESVYRIPFDEAMQTKRLYGYKPAGDTDSEDDMDPQKISGKETDVEVDKAVSLSADAKIAKISDDQRLVFGWAYVTHDNAGQVNVDKSGDFIDAVEEIEKSAYEFILKSRNGDSNHDAKVVSTIVESVVFTPEKIEKMGISEGSVPLGWWVGFKVTDDDVWGRVKNGELRAFSIGGKGTRKKIEE